jgi:hypothetical protein
VINKLNPIEIPKGFLTHAFPIRDIVEFGQFSPHALRIKASIRKSEAFRLLIS